MMHFGFSGFGLIAMAVFWISVVALAAWLLSYLFPRRIDDTPSRENKPDAGATESALDILQRRYAGGEISRDEYERVRRDLSG